MLACPELLPPLLEVVLSPLRLTRDTPALGPEFGASGGFEGVVLLDFLELLLLPLLELFLLILRAFETAVLT